MGRVLRRRSHVDEATSARQRILAALEDLDINFSSSLWRPSQEETIHTLSSIRIDWELFFRERTFRAHAQPSLAPTYKWLAACWLTGCGGDVRSYSMATVRGRLYAVRQALHSLQVDAESLSTLTPRQIQSAVCALHNVSDQTMTRASQTMRVTLETVQLKAEKDLTKALARACAELAAEKVALVEQLEDERLRFTLRLESLQKKLRGSKPVTLLHPS
jgi:hypothetical protein